MDGRWRLVGGAISWGAYLVGGWLLLSGIAAAGTGPVEQSARSPSPAFTSQAPAVRPAYERAIGLKGLTVSIVDGPTFNCLVPARLVVADAIVITSYEFDTMWHSFDCI